MAVFVRDSRKKPLHPWSQRRARILLSRGRARVVGLQPFVNRFVDVRADDVVVTPVTVRTKDNHSRFNGPKTHAFNAACCRKMALMRPKHGFGSATGDFGSFDTKTFCRLVEGIRYKHCQILQRSDGYVAAFAPTVRSIRQDNAPSHNASAASRRGHYLPALKGQVSRAN